MSMPLSQQQPPAVTIAQQPFSTHSTHGSVGPVIAVLVVIMILGVFAIMIGRLCSGRRIFGYGQYDIESWAETNCSSCIDGRISSPAPRSNSFAPSTSSPMPVQTHLETKQDEQSPQHPPQNL